MSLRIHFSRSCIPRPFILAAVVRIKRLFKCSSTIFIMANTPIRRSIVVICILRHLPASKISFSQYSVTLNIPKVSSFLMFFRVSSLCARRYCPSAVSFRLPRRTFLKANSKLDSETISSIIKPSRCIRILFWLLEPSILWGLTSSRHYNLPNSHP